MTYTYGPASSGAGDNFTDAQWQSMHLATTTDGVINSALNGFAATEGSGLQVLIDTGQAMIHGTWFQSDASTTWNLAAADPTNARVDLIVAQLNLSTKASTLFYKQGTPSALNPVPWPSLEQDTSYWEVNVCAIYVPAGATTLSSSDLGPPSNPQRRIPSGNAIVSVFSGTGPGTFYHHLGVQPDVILFSGGGSTPFPITVDTINDLSCHVYMTSGIATWTGVAIKHL